MCRVIRLDLRRGPVVIRVFLRAYALYTIVFIQHTIVGRVLRLRQNTHWQDYARLDSLLPAPLIVRGRLPYWVLKGSSTQAATGRTELQLIGSIVATARH